MTDPIEEQEIRALNARDDIQRTTGRDLYIYFVPATRVWRAVLNNPGALPVEFPTVDEAINWAYWYAKQ